jgi:hypothetical protein
MTKNKDIKYWTWMLVFFIPIVMATFIVKIVLHWLIDVWFIMDEAHWEVENNKRNK